MVMKTFTRGYPLCAFETECFVWSPLCCFFWNMMIHQWMDWLECAFPPIFQIFVPAFLEKWSWKNGMMGLNIRHTCLKINYQQNSMVYHKSCFPLNISMRGSIPHYHIGKQQPAKSKQCCPTMPNPSQVYAWRWEWKEAFRRVASREDFLWVARCCESATKYKVLGCLNSNIYLVSAFVSDKLTESPCLTEPLYHDVMFNSST